MNRRYKSIYKYKSGKIVYKKFSEVKKKYPKTTILLMFIFIATIVMPIFAATHEVIINDVVVDLTNPDTPNIVIPVPHEVINPLQITINTSNIKDLLEAGGVDAVSGIGKIEYEQILGEVTSNPEHVIDTVGIAETTHTFDLTTIGVYQLRVRAYDKAGNISAWSNQITAEIKPQSPAEQGASATGGEGTVTIGNGALSPGALITLCDDLGNPILDGNGDPITAIVGADGNAILIGVPPGAEGAYTYTQTINGSTSGHSPVLGDVLPAPLVAQGGAEKIFVTGNTAGATINIYNADGDILFLSGDTATEYVLPSGIYYARQVVGGALSNPSNSTIVITQDAFSFAGQSGTASFENTPPTVNMVASFETDLTNIILTFNLPIGTDISIGGLIQESGVTPNDFTNAITYTLTNGGIIEEWIINISRVAIKAGAEGLVVTPANQTLYPSQTLQYIAKLNFEDNASKNVTNDVDWSLSDATIASITAGGEVATIKTGTTEVRAAYSYFEGLVMTVYNGKTDLTVIPTPAPSGGGGNQQQPLQPLPPPIEEPKEEPIKEEPIEEEPIEEKEEEKQSEKPSAPTEEESAGENFSEESDSESYEDSSNADSSNTTDNSNTENSGEIKNEGTESKDSKNKKEQKDVPKEEEETLSSGNVSGQILIEGKPLVNAELLLRSNPIRTKTDSQGRFKFANVPFGKHSLYLADKDLVLQDLLLSRIVVEGAEVVLNFKSSTGSLSDINIDKDNTEVDVLIELTFAMLDKGMADFLGMPLDLRWMPEKMQTAAKVLIENSLSILVALSAVTTFMIILMRRRRRRRFA